MNIKKLFKVKKTKYGVFLEPRCDISMLSKIESTIKKGLKRKK